MLRALLERDPSRPMGARSTSGGGPLNGPNSAGCSFAHPRRDLNGRVLAQDAQCGP